MAKENIEIEFVDDDDDEEGEKPVVYSDCEARLPFSKDELDVIIESLKKCGHEEVMQKVLEEMEEFEFVDEPCPSGVLEEASEMELELEEVKEVTTLRVLEDKESFDELVDSETPSIIMFTSKQCPPCRVAKVALKEIESENDNINVGLLDLDLEGFPQDFAQDLDLTTIPAFLIYYKGERLHRWEGCFGTVDKTKRWILHEYKEVLA